MDSAAAGPVEKRRFWSSWAFSALLMACGTDMDTPLQDAGGRAAGGRNQDATAPPPPGEVPTYAPTFAAIHYEIFFHTCAAIFCHHREELGFNAISPERAYETLVGVVSDTLDCGATGLERVSPGHPERSLLYLKLVDPPCGRKMPLTFSTYMPEREIEQIRIWIERGAPRFEEDE